MILPPLCTLFFEDLSRLWGDSFPQSNRKNRSIIAGSEAPCSNEMKCFTTCTPAWSRLE